MCNKSILGICIVLVSFSLFAGSGESNLPLSKEASFVESYSPSEVTIKATGLGRKDKDALVDLKKAAVYFVLYLGTDPIINTPEAKNKFEAVAESFFAIEHVQPLISWEADKVLSSLETKLPDGKKGYKITKMLRVNKKALMDELTGKGIVTSVQDMATALGLPNIMVIPETPKGQTPLQVFDNNKLAVTAAAAIESYLTARKYEVIVPRASEQLNDISKMQADIKGAEEDISYQLALALGSDVYIVFNGTVENKKAMVSVRAYETTTARLLGTETGYSQTRPSSADQVLVEEAINDAIDKVLSRVNAYWQDDLKKGLQYKLIFKMMGTFDQDKTEEIQDKISDLISKGFALSKENILTDKTMDYLVWAKRDDFKKATELYRYFKEQVAPLAKLNRINVNRKLLIIAVNN